MHMTDKSRHQPLRTALAFLCMILFCLFMEQAYAGPLLQEARAIKAHDGDTVTLKMMKGGMRKTRLIGIDTPEMGQRPWGRRAREHLIDILNHTDWTVFVETDVVKQDKYGRPLVYLWTKQKELINERMVLDGHAVLFTIAPNIKFTDRLTRAERRARQEKKGIWGQKGLKEQPHDYRKKHPRKERGF